MSDSFGCRICIAKNGLRGADLVKLPKTEEEFVEHLESVHHIAVKRAGETDDEAMARLMREHPDARDCVICKEKEKEQFHDRIFETLTDPNKILPTV